MLVETELTREMISNANEKFHQRYQLWAHLGRLPPEPEAFRKISSDLIHDLNYFRNIVVTRITQRENGGIDETHTPVAMLLWCPSCHRRHIDTDKFASKVHHTHACQSCGMVWRPALVPTVGVRFFKNEDNSPPQGGSGEGEPGRVPCYQPTEQWALEKR